jgi:hypothetical protein
MKGHFSRLIVLAGLTLVSCNQATKHDIDTEKIEFSQELADELKVMAEVDQVAANFPQGKYKQWTQERWEKFQDSVFTTHKARLEEIFGEVGYPGYDLVGKEGSHNFWLMVQHSDNDLQFQSRVLETLEIEVKNGNADGRNLGLLTDRVKINSGEEQIYGTQVRYNALGQAYPKPLFDSISVDKRRKEVGLEPLLQYLDMMTLMNFEMNKEMLKSKGITTPHLYNDSITITFKR